MKNENVITYEVYVTGRVQGVAFRHYTKLTADSLGLHGWVRNLTNGQVCINVMGPRDKVYDFLKWCHKGPQAARVDELSFSPIPDLVSNEFSIVR